MKGSKEGYYEYAHQVDFGMLEPSLATKEPEIVITSESSESDIIITKENNVGK
jgi:hypothetical protein